MTEPAADSQVLDSSRSDLLSPAERCRVVASLRRTELAYGFVEMKEPRWDIRSGVPLRRDVVDGRANERHRGFGPYRARQGWYCSPMGIGLSSISKSMPRGDDDRQSLVGADAMAHGLSQAEHSVRATSVARILQTLVPPGSPVRVESFAGSYGDPNASTVKRISSPHAIASVLS